MLSRSPTSELLRELHKPASTALGHRVSVRQFARDRRSPMILSRSPICHLPASEHWIFSIDAPHRNPQLSEPDSPSLRSHSVLQYLNTNDRDLGFPRMSPQHRCRNSENSPRRDIIKPGDQPQQGAIPPPGSTAEAIDSPCATGSTDPFLSTAPYFGRNHQRHRAYRRRPNGRAIIEFLVDPKSGSKWKFLGPSRRCTPTASMCGRARPPS